MVKTVWAEPHTRGLARTAIVLFLVSLGLRPQIVAIGPLLPSMQADLGMSHAIAGLLGTIPVLCMGLFAPVGPWLGRRLGTERAVAAGVALICVFGLLRTQVLDAVPVLALTFGLGVGIALVGPLLPMIVRQRVPARAALVTGAYAAGIVLGATAAAALAVPLAGPELDWRRPLVLLTMVTVGSLVVWLAIERPSSAQNRADAPLPPRLPWRVSRAWTLALLFGAQSTLFYAANAWLPTIYFERGWREADAGLLLALLNGMGLLTALGLPVLVERIGSRRQQMLLSAGASLLGMVGIVLLPDLALAWVIVLGFGLGAVFPLVLSLPVDLAPRAADVGGLAAIMLFGGYLISSAAPFMLGLVRDATGSFATSLWVLVAVAAFLVAASWWFVPGGLGRPAAGR